MVRSARACAAKACATNALAMNALAVNALGVNALGVNALGVNARGVSTSVCAALVCGLFAVVTAGAADCPPIARPAPLSLEAAREAYRDAERRHEWRLREAADPGALLR